jgi:hypothetical protein
MYAYRICYAFNSKLLTKPKYNLLDIDDVIIKIEKTS